MATKTTLSAGRRFNGAGAATALRPVPDPPRDIDAMQQFSHISTFANVLSDHFSQRPDAFVSGEGYLCRYRGQVIGRLVPDCVVAFGVDPDAISDTNAYVLDEVGKPPDFVLEVASESTGRNDYTVKRDAYARYGVGEYWRFDATGGKHHDAPLAGDVLVGDAYARIELREGDDGVIRGYSAALGLEFHWDAGFLRLYDPDAGRYLMTLTENRIARQAAEDRARSAQARADDAETYARRAQARARDAEAAAEQDRAARLAAEAAARDAEARGKALGAARIRAHFVDWLARKEEAERLGVPFTEPMPGLDNNGNGHSPQG